ncbi:unnamed protein product [Rotaria sp. Silwood1]|nr:unnamed protein product [Rotaria sp. Silwood1]
MSSSEKDKLVDGNELEKLNEEHRKKLQSHFSPENVVLTPKRRRYEDNDNEVCEIENDGFQTVRKRNSKRTRPIINKDAQEALDDISVQTTSLGQQVQKQHEKRNTIGRSMVVFNSLSQNGKKINEQRRSDEMNQNVIQKTNNKNIQVQGHEADIHHMLEYNVTHQALQYAVNHQLPPLKIICQPGMKNQLEGTNLIKALCDHIQNDFRKLNKSYNCPIGFDTWYIDKQGALICYTRQIELFVYLWDVSHYPPKLLNTTITPVPPVHLPPQHSIIFKYVPNMISFDEVFEALSDTCQSKFLLEEMKGSKSNKSRHIRLDLSSREEVRKILNNGVFPLNGYLIEVTEFLSPPQILICSRCNCPGHIKKECKEPGDRCRRCGLNKSQGEHQQCVIKCHHCGGDHLATDYRCPIIMKYRGELIEVLRRKPELLPQNVQLFIPVGFRNGGKNFISGQGESSYTLPPQTHTSHLNDWPLLTRTLPTTPNEKRRMDMYENVLQEINMIRKDYDKLKLDLDRREKDLIHKQENYKAKLNTMLNLLALQNNQQNDCISKVYTVVNEVVPIIINSLKTLHIFMEKVVKYTSNSDLQNEYNTFQLIIEQNLVMLNDRNDLIIDHHRATTALNEKANDIFRHGIEIMSSNEQ